MIVILLFVAFIVYIGLYFLWQAAQPYANSAPPAAAQTLFESLLMPQSTVFLVMRGLILIIFLYVVADAVISWSKKRRKTKREMNGNQTAPHNP